MYSNEQRQETTQEQIDNVFRELNDADNRRNSAKKIHISISNIIFVLILFLILIFGIKAFADKQAGKVPDFFGYQIYKVETGSMDPTLPVSSLIISKIPTKEAEIVEDDIITFKYKDDIITHRVVEISTDPNGEKQYKTKGDNPNNTVDPWTISYDDIQAVFKFKLPF